MAREQKVKSKVVQGAVPQPQEQVVPETPPLPAVPPLPVPPESQGLQPRYPTWPSSRPGPRSTPPPSGTRPVNAFRPEQVAEINYDQATGTPSVQGPERDDSMQGATQPETVLDTVGKRKKRL